MGIRGELFTNQVNLDKRSYYFNVKENRNGDVFLQIVESKIKDGQDERRDIVVFADDMQSFLGGMDESLRAVEKIQKERAKIRAEKKAAKEAKYAMGGAPDAEKPAKKIYRRKGESRLVSERRAERKEFSGRLHVVSKRQPDSEKTEY
ncbi:DUF3276 family protein [Treponema sp.]|uniref:DUF3276 family protein n=1 Tax=Treponema sp. TaxID=166 RepID=UPI003F04E99A